VRESGTKGDILTTRTPLAVELRAEERRTSNDGRASVRRFLLVLEPYLYTAPSVLLIALLILVPLVIGMSYAFHDVNLLDPTAGGFVGLANFEQLWGDASFWNALHNTVSWTVTSVALQFGLGLLLATLLNRRFPGRGLIQALVFLPWAIPSYLTGLNWAWLFNPVVGPLPHWLHAIGLMHDPSNLLSSPTHAIWGPIVANVWWGIPFFAITLLAAMQSISPEIYEAAEIDGANAWVRFRSITLPLLAPTITITVLLRTVWIANFADLIVVMTHGGPADTTQTLPSYIFSQAFERLDFGYASAIAAVLLMLLLAYALVLISLRNFIRKRT
jgi:multiple sugar transport system permease protein